MTRRVDLLILGQGLAGTTLAWQAISRGLRVVLVDPGKPNTSSRIAAGLVTPISGQRLTLSHRFQDFWLAADRFYRGMESKLNATFWHVQSSVRLWITEQERDRYESQVRTQHGDLIRSVFSDYGDPALAGGLGGFEMFPAARLDVAAYLETSRQHWQESNDSFCDEIRIDDLITESKQFVVPKLGIAAKWIALCTGPQGELSNSMFPELRLRPNQGDLLTLSIPSLHENRAIHRGVWLVRLPNATFLAGSTHRWSDFDPRPRESDCEELKGKLETLIQCPFQVLDHRTALRPASHDQRPLIGLAGPHRNILVLNGLGSKGSLQAPRCAELVLDSLLDNQPIPADLDWARP